MLLRNAMLRCMPGLLSILLCLTLLAGYVQECRGDWWDFWSWSTPNRVASEAKLPRNLYIGDVDGDGLEDLVQFSKNRIFANKLNFPRDGILHKYIDTNIKRLVLGDFTKAGREHGRVQVCTICEDETFRCYSSSDNNRDLWWWWTQTNFIADNEKPIVGDFDGDGADDILVYKPSTGAMRMYTRIPGKIHFQPMPNFTLGNLANLNRKNLQIFAGEFGRDIGRDDLLLVDPANGRIYRYDAATDENGHKTFWWAFTTKKYFVNNGETVSVANIEGGDRDGVILSKNGKYRFFRLEYSNESLAPINNVELGNLKDFHEVIPFFGRFAAYDNERGASRDDFLLYNNSNAQLIQVDARFDSAKEKMTYWWAYTVNSPRNHEGWPNRRKDKWLVLKSKFKDVATEPHNEAYYRDAFSKSGDSVTGMYRYVEDFSYGTYELDGDVRPGWKQISLKHTETSGVKRWDLSNYALDAWNINNTSQYKGIIAIFNKGGIDYGGAGNRVILHPDHFDQNLFGHEMLHAYGLPHHSFDDSNRVLVSWAAPGEYYDPYDILGSTPKTTRFAGPYDSSGPGVDGYNRYLLNLLPTHRVETLKHGQTQQVKELRIATLDRPESPGPLLLFVDIASNDKKLVVELREDRGWDRNFGDISVLVRLLDKHPTKNFQVAYLQTGGDGPQFTSGEVYQGNGTKIEVLNIDKFGGTAKLKLTY